MRHDHKLFEVKEGEEADPVAIVSKSLDDLTKTVDDRLKAVEAKADTTKLVERLDKLEAKANRPNGGKAADPDREVERKALMSYLRHGPGAPADELKALTVSSDPSGGYLAPIEMSAEFIRDLTTISPIRAVASVRSSIAASVVYPKRLSITNAAWRGETQEQTGSEPGFGQAEVVLKELATYVDVSNQLLADSGGQVDTEVRLALAEDFAAKEGLAFVKGSGPLQPEGLLTADGITELEVASSAFVPSGGLAGWLIDAFYDLHPAYRANASWLVSSEALAVLRKLADDTGRSFWQPALSADVPETILGKRVVEVADLDAPDTTGNVPIIFGDVTTAYRIVDRQAMSLLVNPYLRATEGITRIHATRRVGAAVVQPKAIRKIVVTA